MIIGKATTLDEGIATLQQFRQYQPFRFSGRWYVAEIAGVVHAYRSLAPLKKKAKEGQIAELPYARIG